MFASIAAVVLAASTMFSTTPQYEGPKTTVTVQKEDKKKCKDPIVKIIKNAGWKGKDVRIAWAVSWRESRHQHGVEYGGAYGLFQLQNVHSNKPWWNWSTIHNHQSNANMAYQLWKGSGWGPWGITKSGTGMDTSHYGGWSSWQHQNWIWKPYSHAYYDLFPKECRK
jgi:hypothetical protein